MSRLAPDLFDRRFGDLLEDARSRLPGLAPAWTDHNLHDPGITLLELLAWVAEAQLYGLARPRRDERAAYAALFGLDPRGPQPATGLIWPDRNDPQSPAVLFHRSFVIDRDAAVHTVDADTPAYYPLHRMLWVAGRIVAVRTLLARGGVVDHTATNARGNVAFLPFGDAAGPREVLQIDVACSSEAGLLPTEIARPTDARLVLGIRVDPAVAPVMAEAAPPGRPGTPAYTVEMLAGGVRIPLEVVADSTARFTRTGACVLALSGVPGSPAKFTLELRAPAGFPRPPRVMRIDLNVVPVEQGATVDREVHAGTGGPDQQVLLDVPGLRFGDGAAFRVEIASGGVPMEWARCERVADAGPADAVYELDAARGRVTFGNGVNGRVPPAGEAIYISYPVCAGAAGNAAPGKRWEVRGVSGVYGVNLDPVDGGADAATDEDRRRAARRRARDDHALVTAADIETAALALPALEVARARVLAPRRPRDGRLILVAMRSRSPAETEADTPESSRWLAAVQRRLAQRLPLGLRLVVNGPQYVDFAVRLHIESAPSRDPAEVAGKVRAALAQRLILADAAGHARVREFGVGVSRRDVASWARGVSGVSRLLETVLVDAGGHAVDSVQVPPRGLPRIDLAASDITVARSSAGRAP